MAAGRARPVRNHHVATTRAGDQVRCLHLVVLGPSLITLHAGRSSLRNRHGSLLVMPDITGDLHQGCKARVDGALGPFARTEICRRPHVGRDLDAGAVLAAQRLHRALEQHVLADQLVEDDLLAAEILPIRARRPPAPPRRRPDGAPRHCAERRASPCPRPRRPARPRGSARSRSRGARAGGPERAPPAP